MSQQQKQTELLNEQLSSENQHTNKEDCSNELVYEYNYYDTGIFIRSFDMINFFITAGHFTIADGYNSKQEAYDALKNRHYEIILGLISAMIQFSKYNENV